MTRLTQKALRTYNKKRYSPIGKNRTTFDEPKNKKLVTVIGPAMSYVTTKNTRKTILISNAPYRSTEV